MVDTPGNLAVRFSEKTAFMYKYRQYGKLYHNAEAYGNRKSHYTGAANTVLEMELSESLPRIV